MKKTTKLLSVILAFVMALSCMSMMASAAKTNYKTVAELGNLSAYSPYGTVTRLTTEARLSIVMDSLDLLLAELNILMKDVAVVGDIDLTSIDNAYKTIDKFANLTTATLTGWIVRAAIGDLGDIGWKAWTMNVRRDTHSQIAVLDNLLTFLGDSGTTDVIYKVINKGSLSLGVVGMFVSIDLSVISDIPKLVKGFVYPILSRPDDTATRRDELAAKTASFEDVLQEFVDGIFTKPMNWTSYRVSATGADLGYTLELPDSTKGTTRYFAVSEDKQTITQHDYNFETGEYDETVTYTKAKEFDSEDCTTYVFRAPEGYNGDATLKWYKADGFVEESTGRIQSSYWLPTVAAAMSGENPSLTLELNGSDSVIGLLYKFIPYVFDEMAPTVLNGSVKKLLAGLFDVKFEKIGLKDSAEVEEVKNSVPAEDQSFFTKAQEYYVWEYSDYKVINGTPYYRFQDTYFKGIIPENISTYYYMFDWDWQIDGDFMNKYIPGRADATTTYDTILKSLNNFAADVLDTALVDTLTRKDGTTVALKSAGLQWTRGDNSLIVDNVIKAARTIFNIAPTEIFDEYVDDAELSPYYDMMMNGTNKQAVTGLLAAVIEMLMPQIILPAADKLCVTVGTDSDNDVPFIALGAVVVRELCTQLMPTYDFDAMIYSDYNTKALVNKNADQWLDTILYMGVNLGMFYLRNIADIGEDDTTNGYYSAMAKLNALPAIAEAKKGTTAAGDAMTFAAGSYMVGDIPAWQYLVDWVIDWALVDPNTLADCEYTWGFSKFVNVNTSTNLATYENPWEKLDTIILTILPLDKLLNAGDTGSKTFTETILRDRFVGGILNLNVATVVSILDVPAVADNYLTKTNIADTLLVLIRDILNSILYKVASNTNIIPTSITKISDSSNASASLLTQANLKTIVSTLVGKLYSASNTQGVLVSVLPIANFFVGWTTDPQKYTDPIITIANEDADNSYFYTAKAETLTFINNSKGMLLKHRNSATTDAAYTIYIDAIDAYNAATGVADGGIAFAKKVTDGTIDFGSLTDAQKEVDPGEMAEFAITASDTTERTVRVNITYRFVGKDGEPLGGTQTKTSFLYISPTANEALGTQSTDIYKENTFKQVVVNTNIFGPNGVYVTNKASLVDTVANLKVTAKNNVGDTIYKLTVTYSGLDTTKITNSGEIAKLSGQKLQKNGTDGDSLTATFGTISTAVADALVSGSTIALGSATIKSETQKTGINYNQTSTIGFNYLYYAETQDLIDLYKDEVRAGRSSVNYTAASWAAYEKAMAQTSIITVGPINKTIFEAEFTQDKIDAAYTALNKAIKGLVSSSSSSNGDDLAAAIAPVKTALDAIETNPAKDIDFEDYQLFEYFQYEKQRTSARKMIKSVTGPEDPQAWIENGVYGDDIVDAVLAATSGNVKKGVQATVIPKDMEDPDYLQALADFRPASYTDLEIENQVAMLQYYYNFMVANPRNADLTFLNKEIATAEAKFGTSPVNTDNYYSTDSWNRYVDAYTAAKAITAASKESEAFDAKYELMKAQRDLIPAYASMKESDYLDGELNTLIAKANFILDNYTDGTGIIARKAGVEESEALAQLVQALGVRYSVTVDGSLYEGILYDHPAYSFTDYDRLNSYKEKAKVDSACDKLLDALDNFVVRALEAKPDDDTTTVETTVQVIDGIAPGSIKNIDALLNHVRATITGATTEAKASKSGYMGTGATVDVNLEGVGTVATYVVVIYGDVNGDGAIDAFDAISLDLAIANDTELDGAYALAADVDNSGGKVGSADYAALSAAVCCDRVIDQTR